MIFKKTFSLRNNAKLIYLHRLIFKRKSMSHVRLSNKGILNQTVFFFHLLINELLIEFKSFMSTDDKFYYFQARVEISFKMPALVAFYERLYFAFTKRPKNLFCCTINAESCNSQSCSNFIKNCKNLSKQSR